MASDVVTTEQIIGEIEDALRAGDTSTLAQLNSTAGAMIAAERKRAAEMETRMLTLMTKLRVNKDGGEIQRNQDKIDACAKEHNHLLAVQQQITVDAPSVNLALDRRRKKIELGIEMSTNEKKLAALDYVVRKKLSCNFVAESPDARYEDWKKNRAERAQEETLALHETRTKETLLDQLNKKRVDVLRQMVALRGVKEA